jgi:hypothetical protein
MFLIFGFLVQQILRIIEFQIETKRIFSLTRILINIERCCLEIENLEKLIFVNKNLLNDLRIGCKSPFNLLEFLERDINLEEELEEFEGEFEKDEVFEM